MSSPVVKMKCLLPESTTFSLELSGAVLDCDGIHCRLPYFFPLRLVSRASVPRPRRIRLHGASGSMANECRPQGDSRVLRPVPGSEQVFSTLSVSARYLTAWVAHDSHDRRRSQYGPAELGVGCGLSAAPPSTGHGRGIHRHLRGQTSAALHPK